MDASEIKSLIAEIRAHSKARGLAVSTICRRAHGDSRLVSRLEGGARVWPETAAKIRTWLKADLEAAEQQRRTA